MLTIIVHEVLVGTIPHFLGDLAGVVQVHAHSLLLRTLASEDVGRHWLFDLSLCEQDLLLGLCLLCFDLDDLATRDHANVLQLDLNGIVRQDHADQRGVEATDAADVVFSCPCLHQTAHSCAGVHAVRDGAW